jgi:hypothetical protein
MTVRLVGHLLKVDLGALVRGREYAKGRFGLVLTYPAMLIGSREAMNGDGREFHIADHEFSVAAFAHFFVPEGGGLVGEATINYKKIVLSLPAIYLAATTPIPPLNRS